MLGVSVDRGDLSVAMARIGAVLNTTEPTDALHIITLNPEYIMRSRWDAALKQVIADADVRVADGAGIIAAARLLDGNAHSVARVTGNDLIAALAAAPEKVPLFLLGAASGVAEAAAATLRQQYPGVRIAGTWAGNAGPGDDAEARQRINATGAQVVLVAYGMPKQDFWIARNLPYLNTKVAVGVGGAFDYLAGRVPRAPVWMRARGLEWLYRLIRQPWRWRRILIVWRFAALVLIAAARQRLHPAGGH